jgi:acyl homoserine lactone synthase
MYRFECKQYIQLDEGVIQDLGRFRDRIFIGRLKWSIGDTQENAGVELDQFDVPNTSYVIARDASGNIVGCTRLLPTVKPFLMGDIFPELCAEGVPRNQHTWEISRGAALNINNGRLAAELFDLSLRFALAQGAINVVAVVTCSLERYFKLRGFDCVRLGTAVNYGRDLLVALSFSTEQFYSSRPRLDNS